MTKPVGFDQKVLLNHLDYTVKSMKQYSRKEMYDVLDGYLRNDITGAKSRKNAITMLMKIWYLVDEGMIPVRDEVLSIFTEMTKEERVFVHWGMTIAAYPFFRDAAHELGKLFLLQDEVPAAAIGKRMKERYGDRRRVEVATSAALMSMKSWGLIVPAPNRSYKTVERIEIHNPFLHAFVIQVLLEVLETSALQLDVIQNHPVFFPFSFIFNFVELRNNQKLTIHRQGINEIIAEKSVGGN
jgi:hypothetical protein